ncbi:MAG: prepilin peptidase [Lachnospiraceae bacterium]|nr:prepilin peptidase [Lachnospiraceae bacterium]
MNGLGWPPELPPAFQWIRAGLFFLYLGALSREDLRRRAIPLSLLAAGAAGGLLQAVLQLYFLENTLAAAWAAFWPGVLPGAGLLLLAKITKGAIGPGDGLCFITFAFWIRIVPLFTLLFTALCLSALTGLALMIFRKKSRTDRLPFLPFTMAAALCLFLFGEA